MTEFSIDMKMSKVSLCQQDDLDSDLIKTEFNDDYPCHIYFICRRPKVIIVPEKCKFYGNFMELTFSVQKEFKYQDRTLRLLGERSCNDFELKSRFPFNRFQILDKGVQIIDARSSLYYNMHLNEYNPDMDMEVLYIGQSFGIDGSRTSPDRLKQHSTLQKIYSEAIQNNPDCEIWICLMSFERIMISSFDGINKYPEENHSKDLDRVSSAMYKFVTNKLNEQQIINFTEASLIKYFKPEYNVMYKDKFPNPAHKSYSECYEIDINSVCFELETDVVYTRLYSKTMNPAFEHFGSFTMETRQKRISMFDIFDDRLNDEFSNMKIE